MTSRAFSASIDSAVKPQSARIASLSAPGCAGAAGVPVVRASRTGAGPLLARTYSGDGGELHLNSLGVVSAGGLAPLKARLRLQVALALGLSAHEAFCPA